MPLAAALLIGCGVAGSESPGAAGADIPSEDLNRGNDLWRTLSTDRKRDYAAVCRSADDYAPTRGADVDLAELVSQVNSVYATFGDLPLQDVCASGALWRAMRPEVKAQVAENCRDAAASDLDTSPGRAAAVRGIDRLVFVGALEERLDERSVVLVRDACRDAAVELASLTGS